MAYSYLIAITCIIASSVLFNVTILSYSLMHSGLQVCIKGVSVFQYVGNI